MPGIDLSAQLVALSDLQNSSNLRHVIKGLPDAKHPETIFFNKLNQNRKKPWSDGSDVITWGLKANFEKATTYKGYSQDTTSAPEIQKLFSAYKAWYSKGVKFAETDKEINQGGQALYDYVKERIDNARADLAVSLELDLFGDGSTDVLGNALTANNCLLGTAAALDTAGQASTATYANFVRSSSTGYANCFTLTGTTVGGVTFAQLQQLYARCTFKGQAPDLLITNKSMWNSLHALAKTEKWPIFQVAADKAYDLGYPSALMFGRAYIVPSDVMTATTEGGFNTSDVKKIYFLNTSSWELHVGSDITLGAPMSQEVNGVHAFVQYLKWSGQVACTMPRLNGVYIYS